MKKTFFAALFFALGTLAVNAQSENPTQKGKTTKKATKKEAKGGVTTAKEELPHESHPKEGVDASKHYGGEKTEVEKKVETAEQPLTPSK